MRRRFAKLAGAACLSLGIICAGSLITAPQNVHAEETEVIEEGEHEVLMATGLNDSTAFTGTFGNNGNLRWTYNESTKTITVSGEDYYYNNTYINIPNFNPSAEHIVFKNCTLIYAELSHMFYNMSNLKDIDFSGLNIASISPYETSVRGYGLVTLVDLRSMFSGCSSLKRVDFNELNVDFPYEVEADSLFYGCSSLEYIDMSGIKLHGDATFSGVFQGCNNLKILKTPGTIIGEVTLPKTFYESDGKTFHTRLSSINQGMTLKSRDCNGWSVINGKYYWYEDAIRQGTTGRGKEIYDPDSDAWYWLDAVQDGAKAVSKDVYQESSGGKWVRYDSEGHMIKGWDTVTEDGKKCLYYFDPVTGAMTKGWRNIDGVDWYFDETTGIAYDGWVIEDGKYYWYEHGVKQGTEGRGKEIYDPASDAWYWLDSIQGGAKAVSKDVYQESSGGKWVRYNSTGGMVKGWDTVYANGRNNKYYFYLDTGAMAKGWVNIDGKSYYFDENTGILDTSRK